MKKKYTYYLLRSNQSIDDIRYVGVTTVSLKVRYSGHKYASKTKNYPIYNWWRKRVKQGFKIIIEPIETNFQGNWEEQEQYWIRHYKQMGFDLLNVSKGGLGVITKEQRSLDSRKRSILAHQKPVIALTLDGKFYKEFSSIKEASQEFNVVESSITNVISGFSKSSAGYLWVYKDKYNSSIDYVYNSNSHSIKCYKYTMDKELIYTYNTITQLSKELNRCREYTSTKLKKGDLIINNYIYSLNFYKI